MRTGDISSRWQHRKTLKSSPRMNTTMLQLFLEELLWIESWKLDKKNPHDKGQSWLRWKRQKFLLERKKTHLQEKQSFSAGEVGATLRYAPLPGGGWYCYKHLSHSAQLRWGAYYLASLAIKWSGECPQKSYRTKVEKTQVLKGPLTNSPISAT